MACQTPLRPFVFAPRQPCYPPATIGSFYGFEEDDLCSDGFQWQEYQPVKPVYYWDGCCWQYMGPTPMVPQVWWQACPPVHWWAPPVVVQAVPCATPGAPTSHPATGAE
jgi:hypothetical protein